MIDLDLGLLIKLYYSKFSKISQTNFKRLPFPNESYFSVGIVAIYSTNTGFF